jgi:hypothetical protein
MAQCWEDTWNGKENWCKEEKKMFMAMFKTKNKKQESQVLNALDNIARACFSAELKRVLDALENDMQKTIYLDWWYGGYLWDCDTETREYIRAKRYKHVNDHDWDMACGYISETVSNGMG